MENMHHVVGRFVVFVYVVFLFVSILQYSFRNVSLSTGFPFVLMFQNNKTIRGNSFLCFFIYVIIFDC